MYMYLIYGSNGVRGTGAGDLEKINFLINQFYVKPKLKVC